MKTKRMTILWGMLGGLLWALFVIGAAQWVNLPFIPLPMALPLAFLPPGLVMTVMIGRLARRRFFDDASIDGDRFAPGSAGDIDQRVLANTAEQLVLALALWPFAALVLGGGVVVALGLSFAVMRVLFWVGYRRLPPLRALGFAGTFYPTVVAALWSLAVWAI